MSFRIRGLDPAPFAPLFALSDDELAARGMQLRIADSHPGFPCRVSLDDAEPGEELLLLHHEHHAVSSPYRESGPIFVRRAARTACDVIDRVPPALARRTLSVRAYDRAALMRGGELVEGRALAEHLGHVLADDTIAYVHVHYAKTGCFAARVERAR